MFKQLIIIQGNFMLETKIKLRADAYISFQKYFNEYL